MHEVVNRRRDAMSPKMNVYLDKKKITAVCQKHHIRRLALFGSVLRPDFNPESDIDILVEFEPGKTPGFAFYGIEAELAELLGRKVDLNTPQDLSRRFSDVVLR